jgi:predicted nucleic acid-binding protein
VSLVLDSSVSLAWCFEDERSPAVLAILDRVIETHALVPALWRYEFCNGLLVAQRRKRLDAERRLRLLVEFAGLDIREDPPAREPHWQDFSALADGHGLTGYDAAYLELARRTGLPLATLDDPLRRACDRIGVAILP